MLSIDIRPDLSGLQRAMIALRADQIPFAMSLALNSLAQGVAMAEQDEVRGTFDSPTPFTQNAFFIVRARKTSLTAWVRVKDVQATYLAPYVVGGDRSLGSKRAMLVPRGATTNQYGNLPRGKMKALLGKPDTFVGKIRFKKSGEVVSGVFQRSITARGKRTKGGGEYGTKGNNQNTIGGARSTLKLLVQFEDTTEAPKRLPFEERARGYVKANAARALAKGMQTAMASARK